MAWKDNPLAIDGLASQGFYDEESQRIEQATLNAALADLFTKTPVRAQPVDILQKIIPALDAGHTKPQLLDRVLPGFRQRHELTPEEAQLLKKDPKEHPELEERSKAILELESLLWGTYCKTSRAGQVQELLVQRGLLLVDAKGTRDNVHLTVKVATDDPDLIMEFYVQPRGDQLVKVSGGVRDDCAMVGMTFGEALTERMKRELGGSVTAAIGKLLQVATPDMSALTAAAPGRKVLGVGTPRG